MTAAILSALGGIVAALLKDLIATWLQRRDQEERARAEAEAETARVIEGKADEQRKVDAVDRGGAGAVARRLRDRLAGTPGA